MVAGIFILIAACRKRGSWKKALWPLFFLAMVPILITVCERVPKNSLPITYEWPEGFVFCMICVFEACVRNRLIASNMNYPGFFSQMNLPILITNREMKPAYRTLNPPEATTEQLKCSLTAPVYLSANTRLSGVEIQAGYAFRTEDESVSFSCFVQIESGPGFLTVPLYQNRKPGAMDLFLSSIQPQVASEGEKNITSEKKDV